ncbi:MAG TPA: hypothetical protein VGO98_02015 [Candidatus Saccharimonadales bacterium]|nr:hypothetical protein [Candidatus Saccharimonadales bacterium]
MADKRQVRKSIRQLQRIKTWQLLVLLLLMSFVAASFLRLNNIGMADRRAAVLSADKATTEPFDSTITQKRLYDLQRYVAAHMNTETGPFYLEGQYRRDAQKIVDAAKQSNTAGVNINAEAEAVCKPRFTVWSPLYVQCFADELAKYPPSPDPVQNVALPSTELYRYSFSAPIWSPDFAGWSIVGCLVIIVMIIVRLLSMVVLRMLLKRHYRGI